MLLLQIEYVLTYKYIKNKNILLMPVNGKQFIKWKMDN